MFSNDLLEACKASQRILLTGPSSADGDSIGACLGLKHCIEQKTNARVDLFGTLSFHYTARRSRELQKQPLHKSYDSPVLLMAIGSASPKAEKRL